MGRVEGGVNFALRVIKSGVGRGGGGKLSNTSEGFYRLINMCECIDRKQNDNNVYINLR